MESLIVKGGWVMAPIILGSVVALTLVLERIWFFWSIRLDLKGFSDAVFSLVAKGQKAEALELCGKINHPLARVYESGLERNDDAVQTERVMEREGARQISKVEKNLNFLAVIIGVEPLLGFLGTILGLIQAFMAWEKYSASVTVSTLAGGIYQAMITTAAGLIVAIPYYVIYHIFLGRVSAVAQDLNHYGDEFLGVLNQKSKGR